MDRPTVFMRSTRWNVSSLRNARFLQSEANSERETSQAVVGYGAAGCFRAAPSLWAGLPRTVLNVMGLPKSAQVSIHRFLFFHHKLQCSGHSTCFGSCVNFPRHTVHEWVNRGLLITQQKLFLKTTVNPWHLYLENGFHFETAWKWSYVRVPRHFEVLSHSFTK